MANVTSAQQVGDCRSCRREAPVRVPTASPIMSGGGWPDAWSRAHRACRHSVPLDCRVPTHRRRFLGLALPYGHLQRRYTYASARNAIILLLYCNISVPRARSLARTAHAVRAPPTERVACYRYTASHDTFFILRKKKKRTPTEIATAATIIIIFNNTYTNTATGDEDAPPTDVYKFLRAPDDRPFRISVHAVPAEYIP